MTATVQTRPSDRHMEAVEKAEEIRAQYAEMAETDFSQLVEYLEARLPLPAEKVEIVLPASTITLVQLAWDAETVQVVRRMTVPIFCLSAWVTVAYIFYEIASYGAPILAHGVGEFLTSCFDGAKEAGQVVGWFFVSALSLAAAFMFLTRKRPEAEPELFDAPTRPGSVTAGDVAEAGRIVHNHFYNNAGDRLPAQ